MLTRRELLIKAAGLAGGTIVAGQVAAGLPVAEDQVVTVVTTYPPGGPLFRVPWWPFGNRLLTHKIIARESVQQLMNQLADNRALSVRKLKLGDTVRIRKPVKFAP